MTRKPWTLILVAFCFVSVPAVLIRLGAGALRIDVRTFEEILQNRVGTAGVWAVWILPIAMAVTALVLRRWAFYALGALSLLNAALHLMIALRLQHPVFYGVALFTVASCLTLTAYLLHPGMRILYLDPSLRWWESKPRYQVRLPAELTTEGLSSVTIEDVSASGAMVSLNEATNGDRPKTSCAIGGAELDFSLCDIEFRFRGQIRREFVKDGKASLAIQFQFESPDQRERAKKLVQALALLGCPRRNAQEASWLGLARLCSARVRRLARS